MAITLNIAIIRSRHNVYQDYADASARSLSVEAESHDLLGGDDESEVVGIWPVRIANGDAAPMESLEEAYEAIVAIDDLCDEAKMRDLLTFLFAQGFQAGVEHQQSQLRKLLGVESPKEESLA